MKSQICQNNLKVLRRHLSMLVLVFLCMGATLATKRSSAERLKAGVDPNALVVEPYANPFRTYPLMSDYEKFKKLVAEKNVACYIINTGDFMVKDTSTRKLPFSPLRASSSKYGSTKPLPYASRMPALRTFSPAVISRSS